MWHGEAQSWACCLGPPQTDGDSLWGWSRGSGISESSLCCLKEPPAGDTQGTEGPSCSCDPRGPTGGSSPPPSTTLG